MKAEFYVSNMGSFFLDFDNSFSDVVVGCTSVNKQPRRLGKGDFGSGRDLNH